MRYFTLNKLRFSLRAAPDLREGPVGSGPDRRCNLSPFEMVSIGERAHRELLQPRDKCNLFLKTVGPLKLSCIQMGRSHVASLPHVTAVCARMPDPQGLHLFLKFL